MSQPDLYTGDLEEDLEIVLDFDATAATAIRIIATLNSTLLFDDAPDSETVVSGTTVLTRAWVAGETDTPGFVEYEIEVMWPGDRPQTIRPRGGTRIARDYDYVEPV